ncbi:hypothetical protein ASG89_10160 [Paenibacillus sp. Soil766]|uniref:rhamnosyltransferase WsaF family glycosyltransferase n=1 Tax=Paenibacillus sp. Soil766 TaxID=1736404 RepID=UPI0007103FDB|nr:hypothetical protein [Paenibacillus sp. Soil766]KRE86371.1 hypothetical protein ASG89_10160 [Paenibacillus sp. Soil766]
MSTWLDRLKRLAKKNKLATKVYHQAKSNFISTHIGEITPFQPRRSDNENIRYNLLVPSINKEHVFGGISTAIKFFEQLVPEGCDKRIIMTDASPNEEDTVAFVGYNLVTADQDSTEPFQLVAFNDRYQKTIPVRKTDIFIATAWWTAYNAQRIVQWQEIEYSQQRNKLVYFIQDYEPCFYPWSSQSILAESTYNYEGPQIAVFNTSLLKDYVLNKGFIFKDYYTFEPQLNEVLQEKLETLNLTEKKKRILFYGRPSVLRNGFTLIIEALRIWAWNYDDSSSWEIISIGESHPDILIGNGLNIRSFGKMTLDGYAQALAESAVGVSLMISPHPSYPPLEMAHFGLLVITNSYENKDLSKFHSNISSVETPTPDKISALLIKLCNEFSGNNEIGLNKTYNESYMDKSDLFPFIPEIIKKLNPNNPE